MTGEGVAVDSRRSAPNEDNFLGVVERNSACVDIDTETLHIVLLELTKCCHIWEVVFYTELQPLHRLEQADDVVQCSLVTREQVASVQQASLCVDLFYQCFHIIVFLCL